MKKYFITLLLSLFVVGAVNGQQKNNFEIKFKLKGLNTMRVFAMAHGMNDIVTFEDIPHNNDTGEFTLKGYTPGTAVVSIGFARDERFMSIGHGSSIWVVIYPGANFTVNGELKANSFVEVYPKDGKENDIFVLYTQKVAPIDYKISLLSSKLRKEGENMSEAQKESLKKEIESLKEQQLSTRLEFAKEYKNSTASLWAMEKMLIYSEVKPAVLAPIIREVDVQKYGDNRYYQVVKNRVEGASRTMVGGFCPPIISNKTIDGSTFDIKSIKNKFIIIDFWGTWCGPCMEGIPHLIEFREKNRDKVELVGIASDQYANWKRHMDKAQPDYPNILSGEGELDFVAKFNVQGFPTKLVIDPSGRIVMRETGEDPTFYEKLDKLVNPVNNFTIRIEEPSIKEGDRASGYIYGERDGSSVFNSAISYNGYAIFKGYATEPLVASFSFGSKSFFKGGVPAKSASYWMVISPGSELVIKGDLTGKNFMDFYPYGDAENDIMAQLSKKMMPLTNQSVDLYLKSIKEKESLTPEQLKSIERQMNIVDKDLDEVRVSFVNKNYNSIAALWLMEDMLIRSQINPLDLKPLIEKVDLKKYGNNYYYKAVKDRVLGAESTAIGQECPPVVTNKTLDGSKFDIKSLRGKYLIIDFWGTWCGPCVAGIPHMKAFRDKHSDKVELLGISNDRDIEMWREYVKKNNMNYPNILIGTGEEDFVSKFNVQGFPTKILIDPNGKILYRESGESEEFYVKMEQMIK